MKHKFQRFISAIFILLSANTFNFGPVYANTFNFGPVYANAFNFGPVYANAFNFGPVYANAISDLSMQIPSICD